MGRNDFVFTMLIFVARVHLIAPLKVKFVANLFPLGTDKIIDICRQPLNHYLSDSLYRS